MSEQETEKKLYTCLMRFTILREVTVEADDDEGAIEAVKTMDFVDVGSDLKVLDAEMEDVPARSKQRS